MKLVLTVEQYAKAEEIGKKRQKAALDKKRPSAHGYNESAPHKVHIQGAAAELGISLITGEQWHAYLEDLGGERKPPDVGNNLQVRSTDYKSGHLLVHPGDADEDIFIFVIVNGRNLEIKGWMTGAEAKAQKYWGDKARNKRPAYWIPQPDLKPFKTLLKTIPGAPFVEVKD
jgi:hypothetical protein